MSGNGYQLNFSELLSRHGRIRIPLIQRDYAQGRLDQKDVRDEFLDALHRALSLPVDSAELPINLDFIYGSVEGETPSCFQPLDGQQRLTTLFLMHWYLAWQDDCISEFQELCADGAVSRFSYQVRPSSTEFFDALVTFNPECSPKRAQKISEFLKNQPWYFRSWRLDPTVQSILVMLDTIHLKFGSESGMYARLTDSKQPSITFQLLDLKNFGLSDDLYIKMNARGKPLTQFETFKARYELTLGELFANETRLLDEQNVPVSEFFSRRMDTRWADLFWVFRDSETHLFDEAVMNLFRAIILITRSPKSEKFVDDVAKLRYPFERNSFVFFHNSDWLDRDFSETLITLLEVWCENKSEFSCQLVNETYFDEKAIFKKILEDPTALSYEEIVQLAAYAQYLKFHMGGVNPIAFQEWMRVVLNLSVNTEFNRPSDLQRVLSAIAEMEPKMNSIIDHLAKSDTEIGGFNQAQVSEEKLKARLLLADNEWRPLLVLAEAHGYFRGQIGFLLQFCGATSHPAANSGCGWAESDLQVFKQAFNDYFQKADVMFDRSGLRSLPNFLWERALLVFGDYLLSAGRNHSFLVNSQADQVSWKRMLRIAATDSNQGRILKSLWDRLTLTTNISEQLNIMIAGASGIEPWREALIAAPSAIEYCKQRMIRRADGGVIYLLKKSQMNGAHAELFTFNLRERVLLPARSRGEIQTFDLIYYEDSNTAEDEPGVLIRVEIGTQGHLFFVVFKDSKYCITYNVLEPKVDTLSVVLEELGFVMNSYKYTKRCSPTEVESFLFMLDKRLSELVST
ncbi:MAG: DUF262 domain-containing protein [Pseudohongiella sp.]|nr:DUF262 domain-containing protein [Pseudohongiella sp.]